MLVITWHLPQTEAPQGIFASGIVPAWDTLTSASYQWENWADVDVWKAYDHQPSIPFEYHKYLVDYARSLLYEDEGDGSSSDRFMGKYLINRATIKQIYARQKNPVHGRVIDVLDGQVAQSNW